MKLLKAILLMVFLTAAQVLRAVSILPAAGLAMPLFQQDGAARAMAMGSSYVGIAQGTAALLWNPAGLGSLESAEFGLHHNSGLGDDIQEILVFGMKIGTLGGFAVSLDSSNNGLFESRDSLGNLTGTNTAESMGMSLGWGREFLPGISLGFAIKADQQTLAGVSYNALACDLGILWKISRSINFGLAYSNIGNNPDNITLASGLRAGLSYNTGITDANKLLLAVSTEIQAGGPASINIGAEDTISGVFAIRLGYVLNTTNQELSGVSGVTGGLGIKMQGITVDYACVPFGDLGISNKLSLTYAFSQPFSFLPVRSKNTLPQETTDNATKNQEYIPKPAGLKGVVFEDVHFEFDSADLDDAAQAIILRDIKVIKDHPTIKILIEGHTSKHGGEEYNKELSWERAQAIEDFILKQSDVSPDRISIIGYGATRPQTYEYVPDDINSEAAKSNMRGVFNIVVPETAPAH
jgi:outer membrane protein OmpA-like peptidoglycan-associated protein